MGIHFAFLNPYFSNYCPGLYKGNSGTVLLDMLLAIMVFVHLLLL